MVTSCVTTPWPELETDSSLSPLHLRLDCSRDFNQGRGVALVPALHCPGPQAGAAHAKNGARSNSAAAAFSQSWGLKPAVTHLAAADHWDAAANNTSPQHLHKNLTVLIIGALVRKPHTLHFQGTKVLDIADKVLDVIKSHPELDSIIIHVCTNDNPKQQSEVLKLDITHWFNIFKSLKGKIHVSESKCLYLERKIWTFSLSLMATSICMKID